MEVVTLNKETFLLKCKELIAKIDVKPDMVIGVLNGGGYIIDAIRGESSFEREVFQLIKLQRPIEIKKEKYIFKLFLKLMPYALLNKLRIYESIQARKSISALDLIELSQQKIDFNPSSNSIELINTILIVDDAIDTGRTMFIIKNNLSKMFPDAKINIAVVSWTQETSIIAPDYNIFKNILVRFPWSKDYKGKDFEKKSFSC